MPETMRMIRETVARFKAELLSEPLEDVARKYIFTGTPFVFRDDPEQLVVLKQHLSQRLSLVEQDIVIVGSAQTGFSLDPNTFPRQFHDGSDIDVLVVDAKLFDTLWHAILQWHYPRRTRQLPQDDWQWVRRRSQEVYWGWFVPDSLRFEGLTRPAGLRPLRDISTAWFNAFRSLGLYPELASRAVSGRLYRSWEHAMLYHVNGLRIIRERIVRPQRGGIRHEL